MIKPAERIEHKKESPLPVWFAWTITPEREGEHKLVLDLSEQLPKPQSIDRSPPSGSHTVSGLDIGAFLVSQQLELNGKLSDVHDVPTLTIPVTVFTIYGIPEWQFRSLQVLGGLLAIPVIGLLALVPPAVGRAVLWGNNRLGAMWATRVRAPLLKPTPGNVGEYDVAISFAGEDREFAEALATALVAEGLSVFYDRERTARLAGENLVVLLSRVFRNEARYSVPIVSRHYPESKWTHVELEAMQARRMQQPDYRRSRPAKATRRKLGRGDCTGRLFRDGKAAISCQVAEAVERLRTTQETWQARLEKHWAVARGVWKPVRYSRVRRRCRPLAAAVFDLNSR